MKKFILLMLFIPCVEAGWFTPDNYWQCLLDDMQTVQNDIVAKEVVALCKQEFSFHDRAFVEKKQHWFGPRTAGECVIKYGKQVRSEIAARHIQAACYKLYPKQVEDD